MGGSCEVEALGSLLCGGGGGDILPFSRDGTGDHVVPPPALGVELKAPQDLPLT